MRSGEVRQAMFAVQILGFQGDGKGHQMHRTVSRQGGFGFASLGAVGFVVLLVTGCGNTDPDGAPVSSHSTSSTTSSSPSETSTSEATTESPTPVTQQTQVPATVVVTEGAACGPRGAVAAFADGATAYCARLQYTDGAAWSRDPSLAPNPAVGQMMEQSGPQIGDQCIGADIGRTGTDAYGNAILCDNYQWVLNVGQEPRHPWVDEQLRWAECLETRTEEECRVAGN